MVTHLPDFCEKDNLKTVLFGQGWEKLPNWECLFLHRQQDLFLSVYVDDIILNGRKTKPQPYVEEIDETR